MKEREDVANLKLIFAQAKCLQKSMRVCVCVRGRESETDVDASACRSYMATD